MQGGGQESLIVLVGGAASASSLQREHLVSVFPQKRHGRKGKVFVEEKPHAGAGSQDASPKRAGTPAKERAAARSSAVMPG